MKKNKRVVTLRLHDDRPADRLILNWVHDQISRSPGTLSSLIKKTLLDVITETVPENKIAEFIKKPYPNFDGRSLNDSSVEEFLLGKLTEKNKPATEPRQHIESNESPVINTESSQHDTRQNHDFNDFDQEPKAPRQFKNQDTQEKRQQNNLRKFAQNAEF